MESQFGYMQKRKKPHIAMFCFGWISYLVSDIEKLDKADRTKAEAMNRLSRIYTERMNGLHRFHGLIS